MIAAVEQAMLARLKDVAEAGGYPWRWRTLETFPADWEAYMDSDQLIQCPGAWVVFAGWNGVERIDDEEAPMLIANASFGLLVADRNDRPDERYQRHGGVDPAVEPGSYRLMLGAIAALAGQMLGLDLAGPLEAGPLRPVMPTAASGRQRMSRLACEFTVRLPITLVLDGADAPADLRTLHINWDVPAYDSPVPIDADPDAPGRQLPDDTHADATDIVALPGD